MATVSPLRMPGESVVAWYRLIALAVLLVVAMILILIPLAFLAALASLVTAGAARRS